MWEPTINKYHRLKTIQPYFNNILIQKKTFEIREDDRDFKVGDFLLLEEFCSKEGYTGSNILVEIMDTFYPHEHEGLKANYVILSIKNYYSGNVVRVKDLKKNRKGRLRSDWDAKYLFGEIDHIAVYWDGLKKSMTAFSKNVEFVSVQFEDVKEPEWEEIKPQLQIA